MAYEAMNNAGHLGKRMIVILNDNEMSIAPPVGAMSSYLSRLYAGAPFQEFKALAKGAVSFLPPPFQEGAKRAKDVFKHMTVGGTLFEELGFSYIGPIDGHDMEQLLSVLRTVKSRADGPILIHAITKKGKGYAPAEAASDKGHATAKFDVISGEQAKAKSNAPSYKPDQGSGEGRQDRRGDGGDARRHGAGAVHGPLCQPMLRCRHCRAARRDLCRRSRGGRHEAVLRDLFDLPAAWL